jgi:hypothetical protein
LLHDLMLFHNAAVIFGTDDLLLLNATHTGSVVHFVVLSTWRHAIQPPFKTPQAFCRGKSPFALPYPCFWYLLDHLIFHLHSIHVHNTFEFQTLQQMKGDRANWDDSTTSLFLDLVIQQKKPIPLERQNPNLTRVGKCASCLQWCHDVRVSQETAPEQVQQAQMHYYNWREGQTHTRLGRDPRTREVTIDPSFDAGNGVLTSIFSLSPFY